MATRTQIITELENLIGNVVGQVSSSSLENLASATPRDTSYHASRWVGRVGGPPASRNTPDTRSGRAAAVSFGQQAASRAAVRAYRFGQGNVFISNDGNFIEQLNGRNGFVQGAVNAAIRSISVRGLT